MTVSTLEVSHSYQPAAAMAAEAIPFQYLDARDLVVTHVAVATGVRTEMTAGVGYVIGGDGMSVTGRVTALSAWPVGDLFVIERRTIPVQPARIVPYEPLPAVAIERQLDRMALRSQEDGHDVADLERRAIRVPAGETAPVLAPAVQRRGGYKMLGIDPDTGAVEVQSVPIAYRGDPGGSNNTRQSLAELKAAAISDATSLYDGSLWTWTPGDYSATRAADLDTRIVRADSTALAVGAWVRQTAAGIAYGAGTAADQLAKVPQPKSALNSFLPLLTWLTSYNQVTGGETLFYDFGSSVGNGAALGGQAATQNPGAYFFAQARLFFDPLNIARFTRINGSVDGSTLTDMLTKWTATIASAGPKCSFGVPGMNDFQMSQVNTSQTFNPSTGSPALLRAILRKAQQIGCTVVLSTSPHPHIGRLTYDFFTVNPTIDQRYPVNVDAPVPPASVLPTAENSRPFVPWKGASIQVDARFLRGNDMIRQLAAEFGCPLIDAERKQFDLLAQGYGYDDMYAENDPANPNDDETVHPNLWTIQNTYHAGIDDLFAGMRNDSVLTAQPSAIGPRLGVNADETAPYATRIAPTGGDGIALFEKEDGTDVLTIAADGAIDQAGGPSARLAPVMTRRTGLDLALGEPHDGFTGAANTALAQNFVMPANAGALIRVYGFSGSGRRGAIYTAVSSANAVVIGPEAGGAGDPAPWAISSAGLTISVTPLSANTNLKIRFETW